MTSRGDTTILSAEVPLAEMFGYASEIRTMTSGRGTFTMHFERYQAVPFSLAEEIAQSLRSSDGHGSPGLPKGG